MSTSLDLSKLSLMDALDLAILIEEEAHQRYKLFARQIGRTGNRNDAGAFFESMADNEAKHGNELLERRIERFGKVPMKVKLTDLFDIQDEVASSIAEALVENFDGLETKPASRSDNLAASQAYRTGRLHWWRRTPAELQKAIEMFAKALEHDAQFAPAYAAMADTYLLLSQYGNITTLKATEKAQDMIEKALALDPESPEAFAALGLARWQIGQMDAAESALRHAVDLNADYIPAQLWLAGVLGEMGRNKIEVRLNTEVKKAIIDAEDADSVPLEDVLSIPGEISRRQ